MIKYGLMACIIAVSNVSAMNNRPDRDGMRQDEKERLERIDEINRQAYDAHKKAYSNAQIGELRAELSRLTHDTWPERCENEWNERLGKPVTESDDLKKKRERMAALGKQIDAYDAHQTAMAKLGRFGKKQ